jgi:DNA-binding PadR family transcriptional regulator
LAESFHERSVQELRRGVLQVAVLALLQNRAYGYDLLRVLSDRGLPTEEGTLYPILRRLENEGLLAAEWDTSGARPRKYYRSTAAGRAALAALSEEWSRVDASLRNVLDALETRHVR